MNWKKKKCYNHITDAFSEILFEISLVLSSLHWSIWFIVMVVLVVMIVVVVIVAAAGGAVAGFVVAVAVEFLMYKYKKNSPINITAAAAQ